MTIQKSNIGQIAGSGCSRVGQTQFELELVEDAGWKWMVSA